MTECDTSWTGGVYGNGRPRKHLPGNRSTSAARWVYAERHGIPLDALRGLVVRHICDNGDCVNPDHLILGTQQQNHRDAMERGRHSHGEIHGCHKLTEEQVRDIRARYVKGRTRWQPGNAKELCAEFAIARTTLIDIVNGRKWSHVVG